MPFDIAEVECVLPHQREQIWELLSWPQWYPRFFRGIGHCQPDEHGGFRALTGSSRFGPHEFQFRVSASVPPQSLTLEGGHATIAKVHLADAAAAGTRVTLTFFRPALAHPAAAVARKAAVVEWALAGLGRVDEYLSGAPASVVARGVHPLGPARIGHQIVNARALPSPWPGRGIRQFRALSKWGFTLPGGYAIGALGFPSRIAVADDQRAHGYAEFSDRIAQLAGALAARGLNAGRPVGLLARNHCGFIEVAAACGMLGTDVVLFNTGLSAGQVGEIAARQELAALFLDEEFVPLAAQVAESVARFAITPSSEASGLPRVADLIAAGPAWEAKPPQPGRLIVLTSGTGGIPKTVIPPHPRGLQALASVVERMPLRSGEVVHIAAPLFHIWGLDWLYLGMAPASTVLLRSHFDAEECLAAIARHRVTVLVAVPIMLRRILDLPRAVRAHYDTSSLRVVASGGAPLDPGLVGEFMEDFGDVLYNFYGSTELSSATIARPADLRVAPGTAGRAQWGTRLEILDPDGRPVPRGAVGRVFAGNSTVFPGQVGDTPERVRGLLNSGDLGYLDAEDRLFVVGRDDEMTVCGGENVFPQTLELTLAMMPQIAEVAVVGVPDREFGQRLAAFVVSKPGAALDAAEVLEYARARLSRFQVPREVVFVDSLPRTATGKVRKKALPVTAHPLAEPSPDDSASLEENAFRRATNAEGAAAAPSPGHRADTVHPRVRRTQ